VADDNNRTIVARIQNRRGLKQDLPQPLRVGEVGFTTDSRQVYIGADSQHPNSSQYSAISYFENTLNARAHTESIVDNQLIAFTVPFIKFSPGEFNNLKKNKSWQPDASRSIINSAQSPRCRYTSSTQPVFGVNATASIKATVEDDSASARSSFNITGAPSDLSRILGKDTAGGNTLVHGDFVRQADGSALPGLEGPVRIDNSQRIDNNTYRVTLAGGKGTVIDSGTELEFFRYPTTNLFSSYTGPDETQREFVNGDVVVKKNGTQLVPDDNSVKDLPGPTADFVFDASNVSTSGSHVLTLRTAPSAQDTVTLNYYSNTAVLGALEGVPITGKDPNKKYVSRTVPKESFYSEYDIEDFLRVDPESLRISDTSGLGYIAFNQHQISVLAKSTADVSNVALGNLLVHRSDSVLDTTNTEIENSLPESTPSTVEIDFSSGSSVEFNNNLAVFSVPGANISGPQDRYRYDHLRISTSNDHYIEQAVAYYPVSSVPATGTVEVEVPDIENAVFVRNAEANLDTNSNVLTVTGDVRGVQPNDTVTVFTHDSNISGDVVNVSSNVFTLSNVSALSNTTVTFVNHATGDSSNTFQVLIPSHSLDKNGVDAVVVFSENFGENSNTNFIVRDTDTIVVEDSVTNLANVSNTQETGKVRPVLQDNAEGVTVDPILSIDLSSATTLQEASDIVSEDRNISIPAAGISTLDANSVGTVSIFPEMFVMPNNDNRVVVTQRSGYSSVDIGGVEFELFEDSQGTLSNLKLEPRAYDRDDTVRAKLEKWLNSMLIDRRVNLFEQVLLGGNAYTNNSNLVSNLGNYQLEIDDTFGEILFCTREECNNFNYLVNNIYSDSAFDRRQDALGGARGLVNYKNNIEILTADAASSGQKTLSYLSMETATILRGDIATVDSTVFGLETELYNNFVVEYSINEVSGTGSDKYSRTGTMLISARPDVGTSNAVVITDTYSSYVDSEANIAVEPKFSASMSGTTVNVKLEGQPEPNGGISDIAHNLNSTLTLRYVLRRWAGTS
jgi:hypothetical protein